MAAASSPVKEQFVDRHQQVLPRHGGGGPGGIGTGGRGGGGGGGGDDANERWSPGVYRVGMWATVVAVTGVFLTMALTYVIRERNPVFWSPLTLPRILWASTAVLLASSATCEAARRSIARDDERMSRIWLGITLSLGCAFLSMQVRAWSELNAAGVFVAGNPHTFFLYLFTAVHAIHLLAGLLLLWYVFVRAVFPFWRDRNAPRRRELADAGTLYWHVMDGIWVALFALLQFRP